VKRLHSKVAHWVDLMVAKMTDCWAETMVVTKVGLTGGWLAAKRADSMARKTRSARQKVICWLAWMDVRIDLVG